MNNIEIRREQITAQEYIDFLKRTDLGSQYPKERFSERIERLVENASISLIACKADGTIIGVCFCITDFAYWMFITDLGVDRSYVGQGIGTQLVNTALEIAGGRRDIIVYTCANSKAVPFYEKIGMKRTTDNIMELNCADWTPFTVE